MIRAARTLALPGLAVLCTLGGLLLLTSCGRAERDLRAPLATAAQHRLLQIEARVTRAAGVEPDGVAASFDRRRGVAIAA